MSVFRTTSGSLNGLLSSAQSSLGAQKALMQIVSQNVANANTPGWTRERVGLYAMGVPGLAVQAGRVEAFRSSAIERSLLGAGQGLGYHQGQVSVLEIAESGINDLDGHGVSAALSGFFTALTELQGAPSDLVERQNVISKAQDLALSIRTAATALEEARGVAEQEAATGITQINDALSQIAQLNHEIATRQSSEAGVADLVGQRDVLLGELASQIGVETISQDDGTVTVTLPNGTALVSGSEAAHVALTGGGADALGVSVTAPGGSTTVVKGGVGGRLGGIMTARDEKLAGAMKALDDMASSLVGKMNAVHAGGVGLDGSTGLPFFEPDANAKGAAGRIAVSATLVSDPKKLAAAKDPNALPGDPDNLAGWIALGDDATAVGGTKSFASAWDAVVSGIARPLSEARAGAEVQEGRRVHFQAARDGISGVDIQEEMVSLTQAQRAFEAATKVVQTVDDLYDQIMRMV